MPVIDVVPALTGPLPWAPSLPLAVRIVVLLASLGAGALTAAVVGSRQSRQRSQERES